MTTEFEYPPTFFMHHRYTLYFLLLLSSSLIQFQTLAQGFPGFSWVKQPSLTTVSTGYAIAVDSAGNSYVTGDFQSSIQFGQYSFQAKGLYDVYVAKYDPAGNVLWATQAGGTAMDRSFGIGIDKSGNSYITGYFSGISIFGSDTLTADSLRDIFIAKFDASGQPMWAKAATGSGDDEAYAISVDAGGNSYLTGKFFNTLSFGSLSLAAAPLDGSEIFVAKYSAAGAPVWVRKAGGPKEDRGAGIAVDVNGNCLVTGSFEGSATFGTVHLQGTDTLFKTFSASYSPSGNLQWVKHSTSGTSSGYAIAVDHAGNSYVTGQVEVEAVFGNDTLVAAYSGCMFILKYNSAGILQWVKKVDATYGWVQGLSIAATKAGDLYLTGYADYTSSWGGSLLFDSITISSSFGSYDTFIARYNAAGSVLWAQPIGGSGFEWGHGIDVDGNHNCYMTGAYGGTASFGSISLTNTATVYASMFIAKVGTGILSDNSVTIQLNGADLSIDLFPNPTSASFTATLISAVSGAATLTITDLLGRAITAQPWALQVGENKHSLSLQGLPTGTYLLKVASDGQTRFARIVKE